MSAFTGQVAGRRPRRWRPSNSRVVDRGGGGWLLGGIVLLGALMRFTALGKQSFWFDEAVTHGIVDRGFGHVLSSVPRSESTPPLYYVLAWVWTRIFGVNEAGLRSFSALCGTMTIPVMWALGSRMVSERVGLVTALLAAFSPLLVWYSQEARSYALLLLLCALSLLALVWSLERPTPRRIATWGVVSAFALCTHYFAAVCVVPETVWLIRTLRVGGALTRGRVIAGLGPLLVTSAALAPLAVHQNDGRARYIAVSGSLPYRFVAFVKQDIVGFSWPGTVSIAVVGVALTAAGCALWSRADRQERAGARPAVVIGAAGVALALMTAVGSDYVDTRNLLPTWPGLALGLGTGLGARKAGRSGKLLLMGYVAFSAVCVASVLINPHFQRSNWRQAARALGAATEIRAIVSTSTAYKSLQPYMHGLSPVPAAGMRLEEVDVLLLDPGMLALSPPPMRREPLLPGFAVVQKVERPTYILLRYRSPVPRFETRDTLLTLYPVRRLSAVVVQRR